MNRAEVAKKLAKNTLIYVGLAVAVVAAIPLLAGMAYGARLLIPIILVAMMVVVAVSPAFRRWFMGQADNSPHYHGMAIPTASLWVHPGHSWANVDPTGKANIGADALMLAALGTLTLVQLPAGGTQVKQGQPLFTLAHGARRLAVLSPVSGTVAAVNQDAVARPALLAEQPYGSGWVVRLEGVELGKECAPLRHGQAARQWWRSEVDRLVLRMGMTDAAPTMADGGLLAKDLSDHFDDAKWNQIAAELFAQPLT